MEPKEFREFATAAIDTVINYTENIRDRQVLPSVEPGYLSQLIPSEAPEKPEKWEDLLKDFEKVILPGVTHWQSPQFSAYFPTGQSYPSIVGEILCAGLGIVGFSWITSPACTELEVIVLNWFGKMLGLPEEFLNCSEGPGGGIIQGSASESTLIGLLAAKQRTTRRIKQENPDIDEEWVKSKLVAYSSNQSNSSVEKSGLLASVPMRLLSVDEKCSLRGETLEKAIKEDLKKGLIPCYLVATLGTTGTCSFDNLEELTAVCQKYKVWCHVDAAFAGAAFICPEYRHLMKGVEHADSFNVNAHKFLLTNFDCSPLWVKNANYLIDAFNVDRIYLEHNREQNKMAPDYRHWQISLGRRFRALKMWTVFRLYGIENLQKHIRQQISLANLFADYVRADNRFEIVPEPSLTLVCFRLKGDNELSKKLLENITARKTLYMVPATYQSKYIIRYVVCSRLTQEKDIEFAWNEIRTQATEVLKFANENGQIVEKIENDLNIDDKKSNFNISKPCHVNEVIVDEKYK